jgi:outer membrane protein TolC
VESIQRLTEQGIGLQVESAQKTLHEASVSLQSLQETVELAEESLRLARVLYAAGGSTQLDIMNAQLALTQARTQYASALYRYHIAHSLIERALGLVAPIDNPNN